MLLLAGWDWAPYTNTQEHDTGVFTKGIWKTVYIVTTSSVALTHIVPHVFYTGPFPTQPLAEHQHGDFNVTVRTHMWSPSGSSGTVKVSSAWGASLEKKINVPKGESSVSMTVVASAKDIMLWWPVRMGGQPLYDVTVSFIPDGSDDIDISASRRVGFRTFALVTGNDTDPNYVQKNRDADGNDNLGMLFRVNGAVVWSRGGNMIPMEVLEGRQSADAYRQLVNSSVDGGMNTLRVWGGGIFLPDVWYDACDEAGVLVYHDMQYAQQGHSPHNDTSEADELRHQIRRLSHHPSIALYDGCNECHVIIGTPTGIYATFVMTIVAEEDQSRVVWPSCPSNGWTNGVNRLTSLPNGSPLGLLPAFASHHHTQQPAVVMQRQRSVATEAAQCTLQPNTDYDQGTIWTHPTASSVGDCCDKCSSNSTCDVAVFNQGVCWFKKFDHPKPVYASGRTAVWPAGHGPIPPPPPPAPPSPGKMETHGPYQHGTGFPSVNGGATLDPFSPNIPITLAPTLTGPQYANVFASEFGCVTMSSFESMSPTLAPEHWGIHGGALPDTCKGGFQSKCEGNNRMAQRNYPCDSIIVAYFGAAQDLNATGEKAFKRQLYQCMLGQALEMKSNIETRRGTNEFGTIIWQLGEVWPTGGWGSLEYGSKGLSGQVIGGRWKPLHYMLKSSIYQDVMATCAGDGTCYIKNDGITPFDGTLTINTVSFDTGTVSGILSKSVSLAAGAGTSEYFSVDLSKVDPTNEILVLSCATDNATVSKNVLALTTPEKMKPSQAEVKVTVAETVNADGTGDISITTDKVALYVMLSTVAQGRFSDNAMLVQPTREPHQVQFIPFKGFDLAQLKATLRVEHLAEYL